ncbi:MAG: Tetratricopeptide repeat protein [Verrucomicrobia bacterium]|nr:Tetratricopeptide repeat protein [Verrucomicrobiota bacterium]
MHPANLQRLLQETSAHLQAGRLEAAARICAQARALAPRDFTVLQLSGSLALRQSRFTEAATWLAAAAKLQPASAPCARRLGFTLAKLARHEEAEKALRTAVSLAPDDAESWDTLGFVLKALGRLEQAIAAHRQAVTLQPSRANSWYNLGHALLFAGKPTEALACQDRALAVDANFPKAHYGRALALQSAHRIPEAIAAFDEALVRDPANQAASSYRLMALNYVDGISARHLFEEHARFGDGLGEAPTPANFQERDRTERKLKIGFLSPDLRDHSVAYFLEPLLAHLDRERFDVVLYHDHFVVDAVSERLRTHASVWRNFVGQCSAFVENQIRADAPDVLVDLAGHTGLNRLELFARRLAPVQLSYLGYPNTTGLREMDFRFVDAITDPMGDADLIHREALVRFSGTAWSYLPPSAAPAPRPRPSLEGNPVIFGCFNNFAKVTDAALNAWARLLARVPGSRLRLKAAGLGEEEIAANVRQRLERAGIALSRVDLIERTHSVEQHLALYHGVDIALDTFPYHGTTTTCEALWMGVPVITLAGDRHAARVGASLLMAVGHPEWVAMDWDGYIRVAATIAADRVTLDRASRGLREKMRASQLTDHAGQAARFGQAISECWSRSIQDAAIVP